jgi:hypothetical protein
MAQRHAAPPRCLWAAHLVLQAVQQDAPLAVHQQRCGAPRQGAVGHKLQAGRLVRLVSRGRRHREQLRRRLQLAAVQQVGVEVEASPRVSHQQLRGRHFYARGPHAAQGSGLAQGDAADGAACKTCGVRNARVHEGANCTAEAWVAH